MGGWMVCMPMEPFLALLSAAMPTLAWRAPTDITKFWSSKTSCRMRPTCFGFGSGWGWGWGWGWGVGVGGLGLGLGLG